MRGLVRRYGTRTALNGVDLALCPGVTGLLGVELRKTSSPPASVEDWERLYPELGHEYLSMASPGTHRHTCR
ncbi:hypothetical protein [Nocardiopsis sp. ATB16-24]|uniref:hypothetical protein n=1 Tax=Nocardiopsis sp. ATB16-24 TaxID=3019555 RepID=UPI0033188AFD